MNAQESNVVEVLLPFWDNVDKAVQIMQRFGDVGGVNVLNSEEGLLEIAYFDIRAARRAVNEIEKCWMGAPCGNRRVYVPGTAAVDRSIVDRISLSEMTLDDPNRDFYTLVFFDVRDAAQYRETLDETDYPPGGSLESSEELHSEWIDEPMRADWRPPVDEWWHPRAHRHGPHGPSRWQKEDGIMTSIAEEDENSEMDSFQMLPGTYSVLLQGIPAELLNKTCVDAILEQAGLANDVVNCTLKSREVGLCVLAIMGQEGVCRCLNHFAGCRWGARATLINSPPEVEKARREVYEKSEWSCEYNTPARDFWMAEDKAVNAMLPRVPKTFTTEGMLTQVAPTSEASTDLSESDEEIGKLQGRAFWYGASSGVM